MPDQPQPERPHRIIPANANARQRKRVVHKPDAAGIVEQSQGGTDQA